MCISKERGEPPARVICIENAGFSEVTFCDCLLPSAQVFTHCWHNCLGCFSHVPVRASLSLCSRKGTLTHPSAYWAMAVEAENMTYDDLKDVDWWADTAQPKIWPMNDEMASVGAKTWPTKTTIGYMKIQSGWLRNPAKKMVGGLSHHDKGFHHLGWCRISSIHSIREILANKC